MELFSQVNDSTIERDSYSHKVLLEIRTFYYLTRFSGKSY